MQHHILRRADAQEGEAQANSRGRRGPGSATVGQPAGSGGNRSALAWDLGYRGLGDVSSSTHENRRPSPPTLLCIWEPTRQSRLSSPQTLIIYISGLCTEAAPPGKPGVKPQGRPVRGRMQGPPPAIMPGFRSPGFAHGRDETDREDRSRDGCLGGSAGDRGDGAADRRLVFRHRLTAENSYQHCLLAPLVAARTGVWWLRHHRLPGGADTHVAPD